MSSKMKKNEVDTVKRFTEMQAQALGVKLELDTTDYTYSKLVAFVKKNKRVASPTDISDTRLPSGKAQKHLAKMVVEGRVVRVSKGQYLPIVTHG